MPSCVVQESPVTGQKRAYAYSWDQEVQIGRDVDLEIIREFGLYDDERVSNYFNAISKEILENSHMRREDTAARFRETEFTFRVLDSPVVNAFALPGGYVYVTRGLMAHMNNEAQLAVVIGHEIGHVAARHASQRGLQQTIGSVVVLGGAILGQELLGLPGETILNLSSQAAGLIFLSYSRNHERESDRLGVEYAAKTGYVAAEGAAFFTSLKRISERAGQSIPSLLSTHPDPGERERNIPRKAREWEEAGYQQTILNTERYMEILDGMIFGDNPRNGFREENTYYHPELAFLFPIPQNWRMINQPSQVVLLSPEQDAVMILRIDSESANPRESVQTFLSANNIETDDQRTTQSGNLTAYEANFFIQDQNQNLGVNIYALEYAGRVYRYINYTERNKFDAMKPRFAATTGGFRQLTDQRILNINPVRLSVRQVERDTRFRDLLPSNLPMNITPEEVEIINQVYLDDTIPAGTFIKIPVQ
ncbi:MAG: peptidase M48 [Balneolaceae bacterium]|nr:MAG: peptidase M48 [Balneolaceae bacterium]